MFLCPFLFSLNLLSCFGFLLYSYTLQVHSGYQHSFPGFLEFFIELFSRHVLPPSTQFNNPTVTFLKWKFDQEILLFKAHFSTLCKSVLNSLAWKKEPFDSYLSLTSSVKLLLCLSLLNSNLQTIPALKYTHWINKCLIKGLTEVATNWAQI